MLLSKLILLLELFSKYVLICVCVDYSWKRDRARGQSSHRVCVCFWTRGEFESYGGSPFV